jgi:hypothetical protein
MQDFCDSQLSDKELELYHGEMKKLSSTTAVDKSTAIFSMPKDARKSEREAFRRLTRLAKTTTPDVGTIKSIAGTNYEATKEGWVNIGPTPTATTTSEK